MAGQRSPFVHRKIQPQHPSKDEFAGMGDATIRHYVRTKQRMIDFAGRQDELAHGYDYGYEYDYDPEYGYEYDAGYYPEDMRDGKRRDGTPSKKPPSHHLAVPVRPFPHQHGNPLLSPGRIRRERSPQPVAPSPDRKRERSRKR